MTNQTKVLTLGQSASALDIFLSTNGNAVSGKYVGFQIYDAASSQVVSGVALNPSLGQYTGSGIIPAGYQIGNWSVKWSIITLGNTLLSANESFVVNDATVTIGFVPTTDQTGGIYEAVRIDIGDPDGAIFNDDFLKRVLIKAVRRLNHRLGLSATNRPQGIPGGFGGPRLRVSPIQVNAEAGTVTPNNDELIDLVIMMMEYLIITSETSSLKRLAATSASGPFAVINSSISQDGISVTNADGVSVSISPSRFGNRVALHRLDVEIREKELENAIKTFLGRQTANYGKMIY